MLSRKLTVSLCALAMMSASAGVARAQEPLDSRTEFTFNNPIELPGMTLPPGTYVFRFADSSTSRKVMQVVAKDGDHKTYGLFPTISANRPQPADKAELRFMETPSGQPTAVKTWWYPGNTIGREFIYPKDQARKLAKATNTEVLTTKSDSTTTSDMSNVDLTYVTPSGEERAYSDQDHRTDSAAANTANSTTTADTTAAASPNQTQFGDRSNATAAAMPTNESASANTATTPAPAAVQSSDNTSMRTAPVQESTSAANTTPHRSRLPKTDTTLPTIALMGLSSLVGGTTLRFRRR